MTGDRTRVRAIQFGVHLPSLLGDARRVNDRQWRALCPFHGDTRPSMHIKRTDARGWKWHCYVCNVGGDACDLIMRRDGKTFPEAMTALDGGAVLPPAPIERPRYWLLLVCDACGDERVELRDFNHLADLRDQAACVPQWEIAPDFVAAIGPRCLGARNAPYVDFGGHNEIRRQRDADTKGVHRRGGNVRVDR